MLSVGVARHVLTQVGLGLLLDGQADLQVVSMLRHEILALMVFKNVLNVEWSDAAWVGGPMPCACNLHVTCHVKHDVCQLRAR
jgi:hypothetical protein